MNKIVGLSVFCLFAITACGGGGSGGNGNVVTPTPSPGTPVNPAPTELSIEGKSQVSLNESIGLVAMLNGNSNGLQFQWQQTSGPDVNALTEHSQVLAFDVKESGDYSFNVTVSSATGAVQFQEDFTFSASESVINAGVRLDHAVPETGKVSLRADALPGLELTALTWQQMSGSPVNLTLPDSQPEFMFFDAPSVTEDTLLQFRAIMTLNNGENVTDDVWVLVKDVTTTSDGFFPDAAGSIVTTDMTPYHADSPYADGLRRCVYNNTVNSACNFSTLPLLGQVITQPTVDDVLDRLLVSHDWMGHRLKQYLENSVAAEDMLRLFRGTTAIVISYDVRPSFYWVATGAIYLDARNFWVTPEERDTLNDVPDFRSNFGNELQFIMPWRYVRNGQDYLQRSAYPRELRLSREFADVEADITWLLYHELAHANDFFPPDRWASIPSSSDPISYFNLMPPDSSTFGSLFPLASTEMTSLAQVSFAGETSSNTQRNYSDDDIENFFAPDSAALYYSFLNEREDYATLFERFMMSHRMGAEADIAILSAENNPEFLVTWGQRSRINDDKLTARTRYAVNNVLPDLNVDEIQATLPAPQLFTPGVSWFENLIGNQAQRSHVDMQMQPADAQRIMPGYMYHHRHATRPGIPNNK